MKGGLDEESLPNFLAAARGAAERSGMTLADIDFVCLLHTKRSMFEALLSELGMTEDQAVYLDDTGHMSGVDSLLGLDRAVRDGRVEDGDAVLLLSAGTGYTWAATVVRWGTSRAADATRHAPRSPRALPSRPHCRRVRGREADVRAARRARESCRECTGRARSREGRQDRDDARELHRGDRALSRRRADGSRRRAALPAPARHRADEPRERLRRPDPDHERGDGAGDRPLARQSARHPGRRLRPRRRRGSGLPRVSRARRRRRFRAAGRRDRSRRPLQYHLLVRNDGAPEGHRAHARDPRGLLHRLRLDVPSSPRERCTPLRLARLQRRVHHADACLLPRLHVRADASVRPRSPDRPRRARAGDSHDARPVAGDRAPRATAASERSGAARWR